MLHFSLLALVSWSCSHVTSRYCATDSFNLYWKSFWRWPRCNTANSFASIFCTDVEWETRSKSFALSSSLLISQNDFIITLRSKLLKNCATHQKIRWLQIVFASFAGYGFEALSVGEFLRLQPSCLLFLWFMSKLEVAWWALIIA